MALTLSTHDIGLLERAIKTTVSPLDHERIEDWGAAILATWRPLLGADQAFFGHGLDGVITTVGDGARTTEAGRAYAEHFWTVDPGVLERRKALGLEVYHRDQIYDRSTFFKVEIGADWCVPNKLFDAMAVSVEMGTNFPADLHFYHDSEGARPFGERGIAILRLLLPAFKAGLEAQRRLGVHRAELASVFDSATQGYALFDMRGSLLHENPALARLLARDPERERLRVSMRALALNFGALAMRARTRNAPTAVDLAPSMFREHRTAVGRYRVSAALLTAGLVARDSCILVALERPERHPLSNEELGDRYMLTAREVEVARLLAEGKRTSDVAEALGVSTHTARHHTERVLAKLGVTTRAGVAALLLAGG
jgi:DNA-binding CsgD family transcriptional regulator